MTEQRSDGLYPYQPSNGTEGAMFTAQFCDRCKRDEKYRRTDDGADGCKILLNTLVFNPGDENYPKEWVSDDAVGLVNPRCTAFEASEQFAQSIGMTTKRR
jgi:hypothetical protein